MAVNSGGLKAVDAPARLPDPLVSRLRAGRALHPGRAVLDDERRHRPRARHPDRLPQPALADVDARLGAAGRPARRHRRARAGPGRRLHRRRARRRRRLRSPASAASLVLLGLRRARLARLRRARRVQALRTGSGEAIQGLFPLLFVFLFISSMNMPRNLIGVDWFRDAATREPGLVPDRVRPQPDHHRLGRRGAGARLRRRRR